MAKNKGKMVSEAIGNMYQNLGKSREGQVRFAKAVLGDDAYKFEHFPNMRARNLGQEEVPIGEVPLGLGPRPRPTGVPEIKAQRQKKILEFLDRTLNVTRPIDGIAIKGLTKGSKRR
jgi:hypothetical protein